MFEEKTEITQSEQPVESAEAAEEKKTPAAEGEATEEGAKKPFRSGNAVNRRRKKVCLFCTDKTATIDYKEPAKLKKFTSERGKILPRRVTGTCALHQREVTRAIKLARVVALLPYTTD